MTKMKTFEPTPEHEALMDAWKQRIGIEGAKLESDVICALAAQLVGNLIALLDHRKYSPEDAMTMVGENIAVGNREAISGLLRPEGEA